MISRSATNEPLGSAKLMKMLTFGASGRDDRDRAVLVQATMPTY